MIYVLFNILRSISNGRVGSRPFFSYLPYDREQLAYDASGNRVSRIWNGQRTSYIYDTRNRLLSLIEEALQGEDQGIPDKQANRKVIRYTYDAQGNLLREYQGEQTTTYAYDAFNRTSRVEQADGRVVQHGYDPEGLRIRLDNNGNVRHFVHDGWHVVNELDETERVQASYIRGHEWLTQLDDQGHMAYYVNNIHGDVTHLTGQQSQILNAYTYDAFGNMLSAREQRGNPFRYAGEMQDALTGLYYLRARFYNPQIARFTQEDTYRGDGLNLYAYVANNPIRYVDPSGYAKVGKLSSSTSCENKGEVFEINKKKVESEEIEDGLGQYPPRSRTFNQAKIDAGIPTSFSPVKQGWVNVNNGGKTGEAMKVYKFLVKETNGYVEKYIIEHRNDSNGRGLHFHVAATKYEGQNLFENGQRYKNLGKDPSTPHIQGHYPESKTGFKEGKK